jgi:aryl-alcohol dehydrogenase-like predicted oxidoreductase
VPITVGAMAELVRAGKVRYLGCPSRAGHDPPGPRDAPDAALQSEWLSRDIEGSPHGLR